MKTTKKPAKKTRASEVVEQDSPMIAGATAVNFQTVESITADFLAEKRKSQKRNGDNSYLDDLELAISMIIANYKEQSWSVNTAIELTRHLDTPPSALMPLFFEWTEKLREAKRIKQLLSVYSFPMWSFK